MTIRRIDFEDPWPVDPDDRVHWCEFFTAFGVDPHTVCIPGWVEADDELRQIRVETYAHDGNDFIIENGRLRREVAVVQLEARALPFPDVL